MATVVSTRPAFEHLDAIRSHIAQDSQLAGDAMVARITDAARRLELFPRSGRVVPEHEHDDVREIFVQSY